MPPEQPGLTTLAAPPTDVGPQVRPPRVDDDPPPRPPKPAKEPKASKDPKPPRPSRRQRLVARRVRRVVRRLDPWSVLKVSLVFYICAYVITMVAGILLWHLAARAEMIDKVEDFVEELGAYTSFELLSDVILARSLLIGAILTIVATGVTVLAAVLFNLISDLVGGIRVVVIEEDSARPAVERTDTVTGSHD